MKRCPECRRDYYDDTLLYCLDDGNALLEGPARRSEPGAVATGFPSDEPQTAILSEPEAVATEFPSDEPQTAIFSEPPVSAGGQFSEAATRAQMPTTEQTTVLPSKSDEIARSAGFDKRLLLAPLMLVVIVLAGLWVYRYITMGSSGAIKSIAVLPFENRNSDADTDYLSDGLAESLIFRLTQLPDLKVSPTSSVMRYKGKEVEIGTIASDLGVDAVLTGRLSKRGDRLNITVELVDTRNNKSLWGEQYERKMSDLLATQREIATTVTEKLQLKLAGDQAKGITKKYTDSNDAYQLYLKGRYSFAKRTKDEMLRSIEYFREAVRLDPKFALAWARISEVYGSMPAYPYLSPKEAFPEAKAAAQRALDIDPTLSEAHTFLAYSLIIFDWNWAEGERSFKRAIELDPNNFSAHFRYGQIYLLPVGRFDEAVSEMNRGLSGEPLDVNMGISVAWAELIRGQNEKALEQVRKFHDLEPNHPLSRWVLSQVLIEMGRDDEAITLTEKWLQEDPNNQLAIRDAGVAYAKAGRRAKAEEMIGRYRELAKTQWVPTGRIAAIYGALGEKDRAFAELEKALEARDWDMHRLNVEVYMRPLRSDPRFDAFVKRLDLPK